MVAMNLVRLEQRSEAERSARRWALGVDIALDLGAAQETEDLNHRILARALDALGADRATLLRLDGGDLIVEATQDVDGRPGMPGFRTPISTQPVLFEALETRRMVRGRVDAEKFPEQLRDALSGAGQMVTLPLILAGEVIGFLNVRRRRDVAFDAEDADTLQLIGNVAAVTLRNSHLLADTQAAKQAMTEFLHVVVHEMRAPLTIIGGYVSMIQEGVFGEPPAACARPLDAVNAKVREAQHLVDELLLAARVENGSLPYQVEDVDIVDSAERAVQRAQPRAELLDALVEARVPETASARADGAHVDRILDNLINNALTYGGDPAHVVVTATSGADPALTVEDNGEGVTSTDREHVFERFYRGSSKSVGARVWASSSAGSWRRLGAGRWLSSPTPETGQVRPAPSRRGRQSPALRRTASGASPAAAGSRNQWSVPWCGSTRAAGTDPAAVACRAARFDSPVTRNATRALALSVGNVIVMRSKGA